MNPEEIERVIGSISEKDVMSFARRKLWDQDVAVSAVGSIEGVSLGPCYPMRCSHTIL